MSEKRYKRFYVSESENQLTIYDNEGLDDYYHLGNDERDVKGICKLLNEQQKEIGLLRLELDIHKHPLWNTREAERKLSEVTNNLANEVKKNGLLNEEINQLRIENMRLKKKGGGNDE